MDIARVKYIFLHCKYKNTNHVNVANFEFEYACLKEFSLIGRVSTKYFEKKNKKQKQVYVRRTKNKTKNRKLITDTISCTEHTKEETLSEPHV